MAERICVDSKIDYPAACNAAETILIHKDLMEDGRYNRIVKALRAADVKINAGEMLAEQTGLPLVTDLHTEYSSLEITIEVVESMEQAIEHIHRHGSGHTEVIITENKP